MTASIPEKIREVRQQITRFEIQYHREPDSVQLLAVSKAHPPESILQAVSAGQTAFGENYVQEALDKMEALQDQSLQWHFIGPIQSNKTRSIAEHFDWVHSVDRLKIARRLSEQRPDFLPPLKILLQVKLDDEVSKAGAEPETAASMAKELAALPNLELAGLMTIPAPGKNIEAQRAGFHQLSLIRDQLLNQGLTTCRELSMGMSEDFEAAIAEGATIIRIGSAIFGPRQQHR